MMEREDVLIYAKRTGFDPFLIENDYLQHIALASIFGEFSTELVFKGGTALQKVYGLNRLSRDLDFDLAGEDGGRIMRAVKRMDDYYKSSISKPKKTKHGFGYRISIDGPSYGAMGVRHVLPLTFNNEEKPESKPEFRTINPGATYMDPDLRTYSLYVMDTEEIMAEKLRALVTRKSVKPSDLYDIWFLLGMGVKVNLDMAQRKVAFDHGTISSTILKRRITEVGPLWEADLKSLVRELPAYRKVAREVLAAL